MLLIIQSKFNNFLLNLKEEEVFLTFLCLSLPSILSNDISWHAKLLKVLNNLAQFEFTLIIIVPKCKNPILRSYFHSHRRISSRLVTRTRNEIELGTLASRVYFTRSHKPLRSFHEVIIIALAGGRASIWITYKFANWRNG